MILWYRIHSSPTPDVYWTKNNTNLPDRYEVSSGGQELTIPDLTEDDAGTYQCFAANAVTETRVRRNFVLRVECKGKKIFPCPPWSLSDIANGCGYFFSKFHNTWNTHKQIQEYISLTSNWLIHTFSRYFDMKVRYIWITAGRNWIFVILLSSIQRNTVSLVLAKKMETKQY